VSTLKNLKKLEKKKNAIHELLKNKNFDIALKAKLHINVGWSYQILDNVAFNAHNQFLQIFGETGILGFLAYSGAILMFVWKALKCSKTYRYLKITFIALIFIFSLSESLLDRYAGISFLAFFYCFLIAKPKLAT
jgi:O-antigen ligase